MMVFFISLIFFNLTILYVGQTQLKKKRPIAQNQRLRMVGLTLIAIQVIWLIFAIINLKYRFL